MAAVALDTALSEVAGLDTVDRGPRVVFGAVAVGLDTVGSNDADGEVNADRLVLESRVFVDWMGPV